MPGLCHVVGFRSRPPPCCFVPAELQEGLGHSIVTGGACDRSCRRLHEGHCLSSACPELLVLLPASNKALGSRGSACQCCERRCGQLAGASGVRSGSCVLPNRGSAVASDFVLPHLGARPMPSWLPRSPSISIILLMAPFFLGLRPRSTRGRSEGHPHAMPKMASCLPTIEESFLLDRPYVIK